MGNIAEVPETIPTPNVVEAANALLRIGYPVEIPDPLCIPGMINIIQIVRCIFR